MADAIPFPRRMATKHGLTAWPLAVRVGFRFAFSFLGLSAWFWLFQYGEKLSAMLARAYQAIWHPLVARIAVHVFHWTAAVTPNFVRDTRYLYALMCSLLVVSALATVAWSVLDRRRMEYVRLNHCMRIFLRYVLGYLMLRYGMDKIFLLQFPTPSLARLTERFGDYSPSSLMWAFVGSSLVYTVFGGLAEVLGALLLLSRRTTTLGALIVFAVMFNVTVMDFSYDVSVKLFCLNLLLMAAYLFVPDLGRLLRFFVFNRPTEPVALGPAGSDPVRKKITLLAKAAVIVLLIVSITLRDWKSYKTIGAGAPRAAMYGLYEVEEFSLGGVMHPPLLTDATRWRYVIFEEPGKITVKSMDDSAKTYWIDYDAGQHAMVIQAKGEAADKSRLEAVEAGGSLTGLEGSFAGQAVSLKLRRVDASSFTLVNRGFHWINENSFTR